MNTSDMLIGTNNIIDLLPRSTNHYKTLREFIIFDTYMMGMLGWFVVLLEPYKILDCDDPNLNKTVRTVETMIGLYYMRILASVGRVHFNRILEHLLVNVSNRDDLTILDIAHLMYNQMPKTLDSLSATELHKYALAVLGRGEIDYDAFIITKVKLKPNDYTRTTLLGTALLVTHQYMIHVITQKTHLYPDTVDIKLKTMLLNIIQSYTEYKLTHNVLGGARLITYLTNLHTSVVSKPVSKKGVVKKFKPKSI